MSNPPPPPPKKKTSQQTSKKKKPNKQKTPKRKQTNTKNKTEIPSFLSMKTRIYMYFIALILYSKKIKAQVLTI